MTKTRGTRLNLIGAVAGSHRLVRVGLAGFVQLVAELVFCFLKFANGLSHSLSQLRQFLCPEKDKDDQQNNDQIWPCQIHKAREQAHNLYFNIRPPAEVAREFGGEGAGQLARWAAINPKAFG